MTTDGAGPWQRHVQRLIQQRRYHDAISVLASAVEAGETDPRALLKLGDLRAKVGALDDAASVYLRAAARYDEAGETLKAQAIRKQVARVQTAQAAKKEPKCEPVSEIASQILARARGLLAAGKPESARIALWSALAVAPHHEPSRELLRQLPHLKRDV